MATLGSRNLTLADIQKRLDSKNKVAPIIELLTQDHEILDDAVVVTCNDGTRHKTSIRTGLPTPTWRKLYGGVQSTKSAVAQVVDSCGMLEALPKVDVDVIDKAPDPAGTMLSETTPHIEAMKQEVEDILFYGDTTANPEKFHGLAVRYGQAAGTDESLSTFNVLSGGATTGQTDCTSIWLIGWGDSTCHLLAPNGGTAGLSHTDMGKRLVTADDGSGDYEAYVDKYKWDVGLCVRDWRSVGRIANIDVSNLEAESSAADLIKLMLRLEERVMHYGGLGAARFSWVMHPRVRTMLRIQMLNKVGNSTLSMENIAGRRVMAFNGTPIRVSRKLRLTEVAP